MADAASAIASTRSHVEASSPEAKIASTDTTAAAKILNEHKLKAAAINILAILNDMDSVRNMARALDASQPIDAAHSTKLGGCCGSAICGARGGTTSVV
jgi:hypothetical protein